MASVMTCPVCHAETNGSRGMCFECGADLAVALAAPPAQQRTERMAPVPRPRPSSQPPHSEVVCPDPDCEAPNQPGATQCAWCRTPLPNAAAAESSSAVGQNGASLQFPWGSVRVTRDRVVDIGRDLAPLAEQLKPYKNVSRTHARLEVAGGDLRVSDLQSTNGTYVNDQRIGEAPRPLKPGDVVRFAADLTAVVQPATP